MPLKKTELFIKIINNIIVDLPSPTSLTYIWNFGSLLGFSLLIQIITGILLAMHYIPDSNLAFNSISHIMRDVNYGWFIRIIHANTASFFFLAVYFHIGKAFYYGSFLRVKLWYSGIVIFILMMAIAFLGYVLPWGQMSFWGATVITNFFSAIPYIGNNIVLWLWGGFSVGKATLNRFYSLHYLLPFILSAIIIIHIFLLHEKGSSISIGIGANSDKIPFHPYFIYKDIYGFILFISFLLVLIFYFPYYLGDAENFILSNPLVTPIHIVPEWYFLFAYAILRCIPNKLGGLIALVLSIVSLFFLPILYKSKILSLTFKPLNKLGYWLFIFNFIFLTWLGSKIVESPYLILSQISSIYYFFYVYIWLPLCSKIEDFYFFF